MPHKILFLTLRTFSVTGGIEKVSKLAGKVLFDLYQKPGSDVKIFSMYDRTSEVDERYFAKKIFRGFRIRKMTFVIKSVLYGKKCDIVILSHLNLLPAGFIIKLLAPKTKLVLIAHGIEAWEKFSSAKRRMLVNCDKILAVSWFTKNSLIDVNNIPANKIAVLNNCLDPFLQEPVKGKKDENLLRRYRINKDDKILLTLTRLASKERYKGYDQVIESLHKLHDQYPEMKYLLIGKYDDTEKRRLGKIIESLNLKKQVIFTGFIPDSELAEHFNLADIYIMPSEKEGFGIVFIEAMHYHLPVIAGNKDGSVDALLNGQLGLLVNPGSKEEISCAIKKILTNKELYFPDQRLLRENFSFEVYKKKWAEIIDGFL